MPIISGWLIFTNNINALNFPENPRILPDFGNRPTNAPGSAPLTS